MCASTIIVRHLDLIAIDSARDFVFAVCNSERLHRDHRFFFYFVDARQSFIPHTGSLHTPPLTMASKKHSLPLLLACLAFSPPSAWAWTGNSLVSAAAPIMITLSSTMMNFDHSTFDQRASIQAAAPSPTKNRSMENYLPRRLYPGTYKNYCGPTPETSVSDGCIAHGWYSDTPADQVDAACKQHDVSYCNCETQFLSRRASHLQRNDETDSNDENESKTPIPLLSSLVALRFATQPILRSYYGIDNEYIDCIHKADQELLTTGIKIRGQQQQSSCSSDPSLTWFCDLSGKGTLAAFEKINLDLFLRDLDAEDARSTTQLSKPSSCSNAMSHFEPSLRALEKKREEDLRDAIDSGKSLSDAATSPAVWMIRDESWIGCSIE